MADYVRFQRGTLSAYQALAERNQLNNNTLYFISEKESTTGSLYMGNKKISSGETSYIASSLDDLLDVNVTGAQEHSFLVKDSVGNWIAKTPNEVAALIQEYIVDNDVPVIDLESDNLSVEIIDNIIQLKDFGKNYYAFVPSVRDGEGNIIKESRYVLTEGFKEGLSPKVTIVEGTPVIAWYESSSEELTDVNYRLDALNNTLSTNTNKITTIENLLNADDGIIQNIEDLFNTIGNPANDENESSGLYKELEDIEKLLNTKIDASKVYTKEETETAIATAINNTSHIRRKIVDSLSDIDVTADDAHLYIYMVPTGLQYADDKYDEYIVIEGLIEKVGSWEVNLDNYVTKDNVLINNVSTDFSVEQQQLSLNPIEISKVVNLQNILNNKVDAQEGYTLLSPDDQKKLAALVIGEDDNLEVSGSVNADNVQGLEEWLNKKAGTVLGLSENNLTDDLFDKLNTSLYITAVETTQLKVDNHKLSIISVDSSKVTGLEEALQLKADNTVVEALDLTVTNLNTTLNELKSNYETDIAEIQDILTWKEI